MRNLGQKSETEISKR